jgi:hypothetical protein
MCNLYSITKGPQAIRDIVRAMRGDVGNFQPLPGVFPDYSAPIVRNTAEGRELAMARWDMPSPVFALNSHLSLSINRVAGPLDISQVKLRGCMASSSTKEMGSIAATASNRMTDCRRRRAIAM